MKDDYHERVFRLHSVYTFADAKTLALNVRTCVRSVALSKRVSRWRTVDVWTSFAGHDILAGSDPIAVRGRPAI